MKVYTDFNETPNPAFRRTPNNPSVTHISFILRICDFIFHSRVMADSSRRRLLGARLLASAASSAAPHSPLALLHTLLSQEAQTEYGPSLGRGDPANQVALARAIHALVAAIRDDDENSTNGTLLEEALALLIDATAKGAPKAAWAAVALLAQGAGRTTGDVPWRRHAAARLVAAACSADVTTASAATAIVEHLPALLVAPPSSPGASVDSQRIGDAAYRAAVEDRRGHALAAALLHAHTARFHAKGTASDVALLLDARRLVLHNVATTDAWQASREALLAVISRLPKLQTQRIATAITVGREVADEAAAPPPPHDVDAPLVNAHKFLRAAQDAMCTKEQASSIASGCLYVRVLGRVAAAAADGADVASAHPNTESHPSAAFFDEHLHRAACVARHALAMLLQIAESARTGGTLARGLASEDGFALLAREVLAATLASNVTVALRRLEATHVSRVTLDAATAAINAHAKALSAASAATASASAAHPCVQDVATTSSSAGRSDCWFERKRLWVVRAFSIDDAETAPGNDGACPAAAHDALFEMIGVPPPRRHLAQSTITTTSLMHDISSAAERYRIAEMVSMLILHHDVPSVRVHATLCARALLHAPRGDKSARARAREYAFWLFPIMIAAFTHQSTNAMSSSSLSSDESGSLFNACLLQAIADASAPRDLTPVVLRLLSRLASSAMPLRSATTPGTHVSAPSDGALANQRVAIRLLTSLWNTTGGRCWPRVHACVSEALLKPPRKPALNASEEQLVRDAALGGWFVQLPDRDALAIDRPVRAASLERICLLDPDDAAVEAIRSVQALVLNVSANPRLATRGLASLTRLVQSRVVDLYSAFTVLRKQGVAAVLGAYLGAALADNPLPDASPVWDLLREYLQLLACVTHEPRAKTEQNLDVFVHSVTTLHAVAGATTRCTCDGVARLAHVSFKSFASFDLADLEELIDADADNSDKPPIWRWPVDAVAAAVRAGSMRSLVAHVHDELVSAVSHVLKYEYARRRRYVGGARGGKAPAIVADVPSLFPTIEGERWNAARRLSAVHYENVRGEIAAGRVSATLLFADALWWTTPEDVHTAYADACEALLSSRDDGGFLSRNAERSSLVIEGWQCFISAWALAGAKSYPQSSSMPTHNTTARAADVAAGSLLARTGVALDEEALGGTRAVAYAIAGFLGWLLPNAQSTLEISDAGTRIGKSAALTHLYMADKQLERVLASLGAMDSSPCLVSDLVTYRAASVLIVSAHKAGDDLPRRAARHATWNLPGTEIAELLTELKSMQSSLHEISLRASAVRGLTRAVGILDGSAAKHSLNAKASTAAAALEMTTSCAGALAHMIGKALHSAGMIDHSALQAIAQLDSAVYKCESAGIKPLLAFMQAPIRIVQGDSEMAYGALVSCLQCIASLSEHVPSDSEWKRRAIEDICAIYRSIFRQALLGWQCARRDGSLQEDGTAWSPPAFAVVDALPSLISVLIVHDPSTGFEAWSEAIDAVQSVLSYEIVQIRAGALSAQVSRSSVHAARAYALLATFGATRRGYEFNVMDAVRSLNDLLESAAAQRADLAVCNSALLGLRDVAALTARQIGDSGVDAAALAAIQHLINATASLESEAETERVYANVRLHHPVAVAMARTCIASAARVAADACRIATLSSWERAKGSHEKESGTLGAFTPYTDWPTTSATFALCDACMRSDDEACTEVMFASFAPSPVLPISSTMLQRMRNAVLTCDCDDWDTPSLAKSVVLCMRSHVSAHASLRELAIEAMAALSANRSFHKTACTAGLVAASIVGAAACAEEAEHLAEEAGAAIRLLFQVWAESSSSRICLAWKHLCTALKWVRGIDAVPDCIADALNDATNALFDATFYPNCDAVPLASAHAMLAELVLEDDCTHSQLRYDDEEDPDDAPWVCALQTHVHLAALIPIKVHDMDLHRLHLYSLMVAHGVKVPWPPLHMSPADVLAALCTSSSTQETWPAWVSVSMAAARCGASVRVAMLEAAAADARAHSVACVLVSAPHAGVWAAHSPHAARASLRLAWATYSAALVGAHKRRAALAMKRVCPEEDGFLLE